MIRINQLSKLGCGPYYQADVPKSIGTSFVAIDSDDSLSSPEPIAVTGPWRLSVGEGQPVSPQTPLTLELDRLVPWRDLSELKNYAGRATYETAVDVPMEFMSSNRAVLLELGEVYEVAGVAINGRDTGIAWAPPFRLEITGAIKPGRNTLRIEVANLLKNHLSPGDCARPSGLLGPVYLRPGNPSLDGYGHSLQGTAEIP